MSMDDDNHKASDKTSTNNNKCGGVADYFAILGVGETLLWKHLQKQDATVMSTAGAGGAGGGENDDGNNDDNNTNNTALQYHDEAGWMERFYREIVDVSIVITTTSQYHQQHHQQQQQQQQQLLQKEGYSIVTQTVAVTGDATMSPPWTTMTTTTMKTTATPQIFDADLHPTLGLKCQVLQLVTELQQQQQQQQQRRQQQNANANKEHHGNGPAANMVGLGRKVGSKIRNQIIHNPMIQNRILNSRQQHQQQQQQQQQQESTTRAVGGEKGDNANDDENDIDGTSDSAAAAAKGSGHYYLAHRRRAPDERDRPAVADLRLAYVRIHTSTVVPMPAVHSMAPETVSGNDEAPASTLASSSPSKAAVPQPPSTQGTAAVGGAGGDTPTTRRAKAGAALRRGLVTGAGIAARVASKNKKWIQNAAAKGGSSNISSPTTTAATSKSTTRRHFFPEDSSFAPVAAGEMVIQPLEELLPLPFEFDEWSVPEEFRVVRLPATTATTASSTKVPSSTSILLAEERGGDMNENYSNSSSSAATTHHVDGSSSSNRDREYRRSQRRIRNTKLFPYSSSMNTTPGANTNNGGTGSNHPEAVFGNDHQEVRESHSGMGMEAYMDGNAFLRSPSSVSSSASNATSSTATTSSRQQHHHHYHGAAVSSKYSPKLASPREDNEEEFGIPSSRQHTKNAVDPEVYMPVLVHNVNQIVDPLEHHQQQGTTAAAINDYIYVPVVAIRRQRVGNEERYHEDPAVVELGITLSNHTGAAVMPSMDDDDDEEEEEATAAGLLSRTKWTFGGASSSLPPASSSSSPIPPQQQQLQMVGQHLLGIPQILARHNAPMGFADAPFATRVLDRFPLKNYKGVPLPEEELPMFCYPTGCRFHRDRFSNAPLAQCYGFVVKNERGDNIHVSCVSFMEPLTSDKIQQLNRMSIQRAKTSLAHRFYCMRVARAREQKNRQAEQSTVSDLKSLDETTTSVATTNSAATTDFLESLGGDWGNCFDDEDDNNGMLKGFDDMTTFENKTICLISRYPYWTAFRRFLSHLHVLSGSSSLIPLERCISHLLLTVPVPKAGGPNVIIPLPTMSIPMILTMPPVKDLPLLDLPFSRLLACLDVPTIVTVVLGFLALERKVIILSTHPSLVLDGCELLRTLLFPFELCAPYVPRLTEPFMSCLNFPGAIFVGIHDDGTEEGLASVVRRNPPEDSAIVDLDTGEIDCSGDRYEILQQYWGIIPAGPRAMLVSEIETLCRDSGVVPGQEPLDSQIDSSFAASLHTPVQDVSAGSASPVEPLDDRAIRDAFLRFFCSVLGGYERYLVVPDVDFLISGNEWFDAPGFLANTSPDNAAFLGSLVTTQIFQSFIQRRTEASDVRCLLFDECLAEFHSSPIPYGRLGGDVETVVSSEGGEPHVLFSLLVDQCASGPHAFSHVSEASTALIDESHSFNESETSSAKLEPISSDQCKIFGRRSSESNMFVNANGDIVTAPSDRNLARGSRFVYCMNGTPCFPQKLISEYFLPAEPESLSAELAVTEVSILTRSDNEVDESNRRRKMATSHRGLTKQRRCLWQLPKLMASHVLGAWLMCVPSQVSQPSLSPEYQSRYLLRALGALRLLRGKQKVVPDESAYRALIVACGRSQSDRRVELVKLFGLLRSDGIFPSAVTLGQYTRAIAEGFSKRSVEPHDDFPLDTSGFEVTVSSSREGGVLIDSMKGTQDLDLILASVDTTATTLEQSGRRWRQRADNMETTRDATTSPFSGQEDSRLERTGTFDKGGQSNKRHGHKSWLPVTCSTSFSPPFPKERRSSASASTGGTGGGGQMCLVAIWSRTRACGTCSYIPLDEEIQSGWDAVVGPNDEPSAVACPRCGSLYVPMLGVREMTMDECMKEEGNQSNEKKAGGGHNLPSQIMPNLYNDDHAAPKSDDNVSFFTYLNPVVMRTSLERYVEERGEDILERDSLRASDPELFYNFWWFCSRFSLPLPLQIRAGGTAGHYCCFSAWDRDTAIHGCRTGARALHSLLEEGLSEFTSSDSGEEHHLTTTEIASLDHFPLLDRFNLQQYSQGVWEDPDLERILVTLVEACDKRDFRPVIESLLRCNERRRQQHVSTEGGSHPSNSILENWSSSNNGAADQREHGPSTMPELDCYRTILYLAKYQCPTAFHVFFPAAARPCKGYHFWCAIGTPLPIFDRMFRDAMKRIQGAPSYTPIHDVSDVALGFRSVFGHLI